MVKNLYLFVSVLEGENRADKMIFPKGFDFLRAEVRLLL
jgi:hypothetical protein